MLIPISVYVLWLLVAAFRQRLPSRRMLNMHTSLLLMVYLLITSGLGIFWVANQQLPVFDWHYLFGYGTLLLVFIHLFFNLPPLLEFDSAVPPLIVIHLYFTKGRVNACGSLHIGALPFIIYNRGRF